MYGARVTAGFFHTLGVAPLLGRSFNPGEDATTAQPVAMLAYSTWQKRFGGRADVIGQTVKLSEVAYTIIGVLPREFEFAPQGQAEFWTPLQPSAGCEARRSCHNLYGIARLRDGVSLQTASAELKVIAADLEKQYPDSNRGQSAALQPLSELVVGEIRPILLMLLTAALVLLLIASVNVASLLLVRSETRKREMAVRGALGASRARLIRQFVTEALVLVIGQALFGLATAYVSMQLLTKLIPPDKALRMPYLQGAGLNPHVLIFAAAIALLNAILFSVTPMIRLPLSELRDGLSEAGRGSAGTVWRRLGSNLVVVELTLAMTLLVGAGLLGKSLYRLLHVDLGFEPDHLATLRVAGPDAEYRKPEQAAALGREVVNRISALPGVQSVAITTILPVTFNGNTVWLRFFDRPFNGEHNEVNQRIVSSGYFTTLQAQLMRGRYFTDAEDASKPKVVLINQAMANKYFPGEDPVGKKFSYQSFDSGTVREIIGVVRDIKDAQLDSETWPTIYMPFNQDPDPHFSLVVRTSQSEESILPALAAAVHEINPAIATRDEATMNGRINESQSAYLHRSSAVLVGGFAALALLLGVVGLYGVIAYSVSQRTREIGVRMALGAERRTVYRLILNDAGRLTIMGIAAGIVFSLMTTSLIGKLLFAVRSWDLATLVSVAAILGSAALAASFLPARRAASVNPVEALRSE
jgi:predicted permease